MMPGVLRRGGFPPSQATVRKHIADNHNTTTRGRLVGGLFLLVMECFPSLRSQEKDNWSGIARTVDRLCLFLVTPVMTFGTIIIFLMGLCNHPPPLPFAGDPHNYREENPRLL